MSAVQTIRLLEFPRQTLRRRLSTVVATAALVLAGLTLAPVEPASAADPEPTLVSGVSALVTAFNAGESVKLEASITVTASDGPLAVPANKSIKLDLNGWTLTATGNTGKAGIGVPARATLDIADSSGLSGTVTATGGDYGAGIGGGNSGAGGTVWITGGTVTAIGGAYSAGIGGGNSGASADVTIGSGAVVTAAGPAFAIGSGGGVANVVKLVNAGTLTIPSGITQSGNFSNSGTLIVRGEIWMDGTLSNTGTIINSGKIAPKGSSGTRTITNDGRIINTGTFSPLITVTVNNFLVTFDESHPLAPVPTNTQRVFASSLTAAQIALPTPLRTGYTFAGWFTAVADGTVWDADTAITSDLTVSARWTLDTHTVTFDSNGGSAVATRDIDYGTTTTAPTAPTWAGHTFDGWFADSATTAWDFGTPVTENITLTAHWSVLPPPLDLPANTTTAQTLANGETVTVSGTGFSAGQQLQVWLHSDPVRLGTLTAETDGTVSGSFTIPANTTGGKHHIVLIDETGAEFSSAAITVTAANTPTTPPAGLAHTGTTDPGGIVFTTLATVLLGVGLLALRRRRQHS